ncbi:MAG: restriction endonuclease subunit S [Bacteroidota bacterium]|nr:restriction endonuclease subunit S [Bacteroidota bacterium]
MNNWTQFKLDDVADVKLSNVDKKTKDNERTIRLCNYTDVYKNSFINDEKAKNFMVASCTDNEYEKFILKGGQVAVTKDSEKPDDIGIPTYISQGFEDVVLGYHLALFTPYIEKLDGQFLYYWLNTKQAKRYFENNAGGSGQRCSLPLNILKAIPLTLPNISTQKSIAKVLSDLDAKIELNNKINQELEAMAKTLYDYWFVQFDFPANLQDSTLSEVEGYKSSGGKMVYNEELKHEIPEGWEVGTLLDIATYTNGLACQKYRPDTDEFLPVIKIREMRDGFTENTEKVKADIPEKLIVNNGDILFSWSASLEVMIWSGGTGGLNQHIFKVTSEKYPKSFFYFQLIWYLKHFKMIADLRKTTMGHITQDHLKQSRIVIPPKEIISKLDIQLSPIQSKQVLLKQQNQQLTALRDWLLPMLMNGQVTV